MWRLFISASCLLILGIYAGPSIGKVYYCKDPDTGVLYPVNSTWPSTTFCGKYTCKLRKKNITEMEYAPSMQKINITKANPVGITIQRQKVSDIQPVLHKQNRFDLADIQKKILNNIENGEDRYLTPDEIKTITELLQSVKKSELVTILEIYNLAQDIYREIDKSSTNEVIEEAFKNSLDVSDLNGIYGGKGRVSYWYEPLIPSKSKDKIDDNNFEGTINAPISLKIKEPYVHTHQARVLNSNNFLNLPYYYPSSFHRHMSYVHPNFATQITPAVTLAPSQRAYPHISFRYNPVRPLHSQNYHHHQPTVLLPYPYSIVNHNNQTNPDPYYNIKPWGGYFNFFNQEKHQELKQDVSPKPLEKKDEKRLKKEKKVNIYKEAKKETKKEKVDKESSKKVRPEWQTDPLPSNILDDVKANILEKTKSLKTLHHPMKKIKLEKIGSLLNLDGFKRDRRRRKRESPVEDEYNPVEYEPFIEKTMCNADIEPGFFRRGNEGDHFPKCCPQRIDSDKEATTPPTSFQNNQTSAEETSFVTEVPSV